MTDRQSSADFVPLEDLRTLTPGTGYDPHAVEAVDDWGREHAGAFAGLVVSGDTLYVGFSENAAENLEALRQLLPGTKIKGFEAKHTYSELLALKDRISDDLQSLRQGGIEISAVGIDVSQNRVVVSFPRAHSPHTAELKSRYGDGILAFDSIGKRYLLNTG